LRALGRLRESLIGVGIAGMVVSGVSFASLSSGAPAKSFDPAAPVAGPIDSAFEALGAGIRDEYGPGRPQMSGMQLASLPPTQVTLEPAPEGNSRRIAASILAAERDLFDARFKPVYEMVHRARFESFKARFAAATVGDREVGGRESAPASVRGPGWLVAAEVRLDMLEVEEAETVRLAALRPTADAPAEIRGPAPIAAAPAAAMPAASAPEKPMRLAYAPSDLPLTDKGNRDARTAIYDISRRIVYMPNGEQLEAHSGLGEHMDDLRTFRIKNKGVTPPNVYKLTLREKLFHGVRAVRMTPVDGSKMYGRDGFLVHSYLLGPSGESNGCVSVANYDKFIKAFDNGEVERLIVVERMDNPPLAPNEPGNWLAERLRALFEAS
jgi:hypothetical protein